jgi:hypothetical protein
MMVVLGYALNSIVSSSGAAVKIIASINKSPGKPIGTYIADPKDTSPQVIIYLLSIKINMLRVSFDSDPVIY